MLGFAIDTEKSPGFIVAALAGLAKLAKDTTELTKAVIKIRTNFIFSSLHIFYSWQLPRATPLWKVFREIFRVV
jgi:hypothetical protein